MFKKCRIRRPNMGRPYAPNMGTRKFRGKENRLGLKKIPAFTVGVPKQIRDGGIFIFFF